jgi:hypothetical protein
MEATLSLADILYPNQGDDMKRPDGTTKSMKGFLGAITRPDGKISTEISAGFEINGKETDSPLMVPGLTKKEIDYLIKTDMDSPTFMKNMPKAIQDKAIKHAEKRMKEGKSVFFDDQEDAK